MSTCLSFCCHELEQVVFFSDQSRGAEFRDALLQEDFKILGLYQGGVGHHPDDELTVSFDGRVTSVAMNCIDGDVRGQLDLSRIEPSRAAVQLGYAQGVFPLLCLQEGKGRGRIGGPIRYPLTSKGRDRCHIWCPHVSCDTVGHMDKPRL